jgi:hypothetical protein
LKLYPRSLAGRTILILLIGFALIQLLGLLIHTLNQIKLQKAEELEESATRAVIIYRHIAMAPPRERAALIAKEPLPPGDSLALAPAPPRQGTYAPPLAVRQIIRASIYTYGNPPPIRPRSRNLSPRHRMMRARGRRRRRPGACRRRISMHGRNSGWW